MALIQCPECGKNISDKADKCIHCGCPASQFLSSDNLTNNSIEMTAEDITKSQEPVCNNELTAAKRNKRFIVRLQQIKHKKIACSILVVGVLLIIVGLTAFFKLNFLTQTESVYVENVSTFIGSIGEVKENSGEVIKKAETAFDDLSFKCQLHVSNRRILNSAIKQYNLIMVEKATSSIEDIKTVSLAREITITTARYVYDELTDEQKSQVKNYSVLCDAEKELGKLQIKDCIKKIDGIGTVSLTSNDVIIDAFNTYDTLSDEQKSKVTNYTDLCNANDSYQKLAIKECIKLIDSIGKVSLKSEKVITEAESSYNNLSAPSQKQVTNYSTLQSASNEYSKQKEAKEKKDKLAELRKIIHVSRVWCSSPNSAGGVDAYISFSNTCSKTIKYINWNVEPYNAVGDVVSSTIGYKTTATLLDTGPFYKGGGHGSGYYWECVWYNSTIESIKLTGIEIEYTDGTTKSISSNDIEYVIY